MPFSKGLGAGIRLTQNSYRQAVSETVRDCQDDLTDQEMAEVWTVSAGTVSNARNRKADLSGLPLLKIGQKFGPEMLDTVLALIGARAIRRDHVSVDVSRIPCDIAKTLPLLIELFADGRCDASDVRKLEQAGAIDCILRVADMLRSARDNVRLEAVA